MSAAALDRALAILIAALLVSGLLSLRAGVPATAPLFILHGLLAGSLLVASTMKVRRSLPRAIGAHRWYAVMLSGLLAALTAAALAGGFVWVASGRILSIGSWTVLTLHVWAALALVPVALAHLVPRRWRTLRPPRRSPQASLLSRRTALALGGLAVAGAATWLAANLVEAAVGGVRRFTGSRWLPAGGTPPATTFYGESVARVDPASWRLRVHGRVARPQSLSLAQLASLGQAESDAVLDCTSGWALRTTWTGTSLGGLLRAVGPERGARRIIVRAVSGWAAELPISEASGALLATRVAGQPLPHGNGAPCRLVVPGRRGLEWVKWVVEVEVA